MPWATEACCKQSKGSSTELQISYYCGPVLELYEKMFYTLGEGAGDPF